MQDFVHTIAASQQNTTEEGLYVRFGKRVLDLILTAIALPLFLPLIAILYFIARRDGGPAFYGHERVGKDGVRFKCWKVRSMVVDSETRLREHLESDAEAAAEWERDHKLTHDPRITRFGAFIRKTSLDELPQILNVIKGEMSFVGPRPVVSEELPRYGSKLNWYLAQKPGITGLWQVSGRNDVSYDERVDMDVSYVNRCSLALDVEIVFRTAFTMLARTGK